LLDGAYQYSIWISAKINKPSIYPAYHLTLKLSNGYVIMIAQIELDVPQHITTELY